MVDAFDGPAGAEGQFVARFRPLPQGIHGSGSDFFVRGKKGAVQVGKEDFRVCLFLHDLFPFCYSVWFWAARL